MSECASCRYSHVEIDDSLHCRRYAPRPHNFLDYAFFDILMEIAWAQRIAAGIEKPKEDDTTFHEGTEQMVNASWPEVDPDEWCGEYQEKPAA